MQAIFEFDTERNKNNMNVINMNGLESQAAKLLHFKEKIDVGLLDKVITSLYSGEGPQVIYFIRMNTVEYLRVKKEIRITFICLLSISAYLILATSSNIRMYCLFCNGTSLKLHCMKYFFK